MSQSVTVFVPRETAAVSMGAHEVAKKIAAHKNVKVVRNGSWGMSWLEPLVEVDVDGKRIGYGPVTVDDVEGLFAAGFLEGGDHAL